MTYTETQVLAHLSRSSFEDFVRHFARFALPVELRWNWHMTVMCAEAQSILERIFKGLPKLYDPLVVNISPGTTKSTIWSVLLPAWAWTRMPHFRMIGASFSHPLQLDLSMKCRDVVQSELYRACFPDVRLREDQNVKSFYKTTAGGFRFSVGSNGNVMGFHADLIVIDDPIDPEKALPKAEIDSVNYWISNTLSTRVVDKSVSATVLIMQRLCQGDPTDLMVRDNPRARHVVLPATLEYPVRPPELARNYVDGHMDPVRLGAAALEPHRRKGAHYFAGQFGQKPVPAGGGTFKTDLIKPGRPPGKYKRTVRGWDKAGTAQVQGLRKSLRAAYTAGVKIAEDFAGRYWVLDVRRFRADSFAREKVIEKEALADGRQCVVAVEKEGGSGGKESAESTQRRLLRLKRRCVVVPARSGKEVRAEEFSIAVNGGTVYIPDVMWDGSGWVGWAKDFVEELTYWPFAEYLDQGDAASTGFNVLRTGNRRAGPLRDSARPRQVVEGVAGLAGNPVDDNLIAG